MLSLKFRCSINFDNFFEKKKKIYTQQSTRKVCHTSMLIKNLSPLTQTVYYFTIEIKLLFIFKVKFLLTMKISNIKIFQVKR